jgi:Nif-specific regulatory protein
MAKKTLSFNASIDRIKEISAWISSVHDLDRFLELILETATQMMNVKDSSLMLLDQKSNKLYFKVATGEKKHDVKKFEVDMGQGIEGFVAQKGEALLIPDIRKDTRWSKEIGESIGFQTRSIACLPMKVKGKILGTIEVIDKTDGSPFADNDMKMLAVYADLAALTIDRTQKIEQGKRKIDYHRNQLGLKYQIIGKSEAISKVMFDAFKVANSKTSTLIVGESGTGKELLARLIHQTSPRRDNLMIVLNCAALPESLMEDELFGHEKGAYTGAMNRKIGKFELANKGILFFDEIGEMSPGMQAKLLRVMQEDTFYRVGGNLPVSVDVRILSATNKNILNEVAKGRFREDLFYRMNVVQIQMPTLRERKEDITLLAEYFLDIFKQQMGLPNLTISKKAMENMLQYDWPGNVRELKNVMERAVVMGKDQEILPEDLPIFGPRTVYQGLQVGLTLNEAINMFKKEFIIANLGHAGGNRTKAAKKMDIQRTYLSRLISKYNIQ